MRAITFDGQLALDAGRAEPVPTESECLVRVHLAGICATDLQIIRGYMNFSGILGHEMVGTVVAGPPQWRNKRVACEINCVCRTCDMCHSGLANHCRNRTVLGIDGRDGCFADLLAVPQRNLHAVPDVLSDEEAVFVEPLAAACQVLVQYPVEKQTPVSVVGSGRLGLLIAQVLASAGCRPIVVGRNPKKLLLCDKKGIQAIHVDDLVPRNDRELVIECTGDPCGLGLALKLVRPRGTILLKSTCADNGAVNLAPIVINEVRVLGSRCGPFPEAINALTRQAVDVRSMISKTFPIEEGLKAFEAARDPNNVKVLLKINP